MFLCKRCWSVCFEEGIEALRRCFVFQKLCFVWLAALGGFVFRTPRHFLGRLDISVDDLQEAALRGDLCLLRKFLTQTGSIDGLFDPRLCLGLILLEDSSQVQ